MSNLDAEFKCWRSYPEEEKNKVEMRKELEESITNTKSKKNTEMQEKVNKVT